MLAMPTAGTTSIPVRNAPAAQLGLDLHGELLCGSGPQLHSQVPARTLVLIFMSNSSGLTPVDDASADLGLDLHDQFLW